tara:strand:- start:290 stop:1756 length:1467 start_codon:yes stop_codon:yes gene_type:complete
MKIYKTTHCGICAKIETKQLVRKIGKQYPNSHPEIKKLKPNYLECVYTPNIVKGIILQKEPFIEDIVFNIHCYSFEAGHSTFLVEMTINKSNLDIFEGTDFFHLPVKFKIDDSIIENTFDSFIWDFMNKMYSIKDMVKLSQNISQIDPKHVEKLQVDFKTKFEMDAFICGNGLGINGYTGNNDSTIIVGNSLDSTLIDWENIGNNKFQLYEYQDKNLLKLENNNLEDQKVFLENFIQQQFIDRIHFCYRSLLYEWLDSIKSEAKSIRKNIPIKNKVFWRNYREKIEAWELYFLELQADLFIMTPRLDFFIFDCYNENYINKWKTEFTPKKDALFRIAEAVRSGLENLATPGKTQDEHSLQLETEKVNERMLMLSFFAVSIPLLGAIIAPGIALQFKMYAAMFLLSLPVGYLLFRKIQKKQNETKSKKLELQRIFNEINFEGLPEVEKRLDELNKDKDLGGSFKVELINIFISQKQYLEKQIQEIKSKL